MNISRKWLREFVDITATDKEYDSVMTLAGQKVETTERMDAEIKNVVVGKVLSMKKHENSDHMWVCMVDCGSGEPVQIVTGAQNVHEGDLVPVAQHNSYLPGGIHITKGKLRGVESCGMLCSYKELGDPSMTAGGVCRRHLDSERRGLRGRRGYERRHRATMIPSSNSRSRTTARTAIRSSDSPVRRPPRSTCR